MKLLNNKNLIVYTLLICVVIILANIDIRSELSKFNQYHILKSNIVFLANIIKQTFLISVIIIVCLIYKILHRKCVFRIEKLNLGGANIIFDRPEEIFLQNMRNFLNTKRTLFMFDEKRDNIYDTIDSFYKIYQFIREEIKIYDPKSSETSETYGNTNKMIHELNEFLTTHQSNYRRWYEYIQNNKLEEIYNKDIDTIQKGYRNYNNLISDITNLNHQFCVYAKCFNIDTLKWNKDDNICKICVD